MVPQAILHRVSSCQDRRFQNAVCCRVLRGATAALPAQHSHQRSAAEGLPGTGGDAAQLLPWHCSCAPVTNVACTTQPRSCISLMHVRYEILHLQPLQYHAQDPACICASSCQIWMEIIRGVHTVPGTWALRACCCKLCMKQSTYCAQVRNQSTHLEDNVPRNAVKSAWCNRRCG